MRAAPLRRVQDWPQAQWVTHHFTYTTSARNAKNESHPPQNIIDYNVWMWSWLFWTKNRKPPRLQRTDTRKDPLWQGHSSKAASAGMCQNTKLQLMLKRFSSIIWRRCSAHIILQMGMKAAMFCITLAAATPAENTSFHIIFVSCLRIRRWEAQPCCRGWGTANCTSLA